MPGATEWMFRFLLGSPTTAVFAARDRIGTGLLLDATKDTLGFEATKALLRRPGLNRNQIRRN